MNFKELADAMVDVYGVPSYQMNEEDVEDGNYWFTCPECDEPILEEDWDANNLTLSGNFICPVCEEVMEFYK